MAVSKTNYGAVEAGGVAATALPATSATDIYPATLCKDRQSMILAVDVVAKGTFNLNLLVSEDGGTTWHVCRQLNSTTVTVDGSVASYTQACNAVWNFTYCFKVQVYNTSGADLDFSAVWRLHSQGG